MKKSSSGRFIAVIAALCILCLSFVITVNAVPAETQSDCSITVKTADFAANTSLGLCKVGRYESGEYILEGRFAECDIDFTDITEAAAAQDAAETLVKAVKESDVRSVSIIDNDGISYFKNLDGGHDLYLVYQIDGQDIIEISPMLIAVSYYNNDGSTVESITVNAKYKDKRTKEVKGAILLHKVDPKKSPLAGAEFTFQVKLYHEGYEQTDLADLYSDRAGDYSWNTIFDDLITDENGQIAVENLPLATYRFIETKAPEGFVLDSTPYEIKVTQKGTLKIIDGIYAADEGKPAEIEVVNKPEEPSEPESSEPESSVPESSVTESSVPESSVPESSVPQPSEPPVITGEQITKYIVIGVVVAISLVAVILLIVLGKKKKNNDDDDDD